MMKENTIEIVGFHAHIYFDADRRDAAERVREGLTRFEVQLGRWHDLCGGLLYVEQTVCAGFGSPPTIFFARKYN